MHKLTTHVDKAQLGTIFRVLTARQDTDTQIYTKDILLGLRDLGVLGLAVETQLKLYSQLSYTSNAVVTFSDNRIKQFASIEELAKFDWERPQTTISVALRWNILIEGKGEEPPSEHNILVRLATGVKPQDFFRAAFSKDIDEIDAFEMASAGCVCHVTFATQSLASDIFHVVQDWVAGRPTGQYAAPYIQWIRHRSDLVFKLIKLSLPVSAVFALLSYFCHITRVLDQSSSATVGFIRLILLYGVILWATYLFAGVLARWLGSHLDGLLDRIGTMHPFTLTAGDKNRQTELAAKNSRNFTRFCVEGSIAVCWNIVAAILIYLFTRPFQP
jgi:hypothetical protein